MDLERARKGGWREESKVGGRWVEIRGERRGSEERRWRRAASISPSQDRDRAAGRMGFWAKGLGCWKGVILCFLEVVLGFGLGFGFFGFSVVEEEGEDGGGGGSGWEDSVTSEGESFGIFLGRKGIFEMGEGF